MKKSREKKTVRMQLVISQKEARPDKRAHGGAGDYEPFRVSAQDGSGRLYYSSGYRRYSGNGAASADLF